MKKILILILMVGVTTSCYDEFRRDFDHSTVAFSTASGDANDAGTLSRTVVKGEGLGLDIGVYLAGVIENKEERWVEYEIDRSLLDDTDYEMMPSSYYTLSDDSRFTIPSGEHVGSITVDLDSTQFVNDPMTVEPHYAIPFRLTGTSVDSILATQATKILVVKYMSQYAGFYNQTGSFTTYDASGTQVSSGEIDNVIEASTVLQDTLQTNGLINQTGIDYRMKLLVDADKEVGVSYYANPNPPEPINIALRDNVETTSSLSPGVNTANGLAVINDGAEATSSTDDPYYGTWGDGETAWNWVEYEWTDNKYQILSSSLYWWHDGGGVQAPTDTYFDFWEEGSDSFVEVPNSELGYEYNTFNEVEFDAPFVTNQLRVNFLDGRTNDGGAVADGIGIIEWEVQGLVAASTPEQQAIANVVLEGDGISLNQSTYTFNLNYRVNFESGGYTIVESEMVWRNRVRDGVNEWRR